ANRDHQAVEPRRIETDLFARDGLRDDWEQRAPQDGEAARHQDQVVEQEARFARDYAFELRFTLEVIEAIEDQIDGRGYADRQERREVFPNRGLREGVNGAHQA